MTSQPEIRDSDYLAMVKPRDNSIEILIDTENIRDGRNGETLGTFK